MAEAIRSRCCANTAAVSGTCTSRIARQDTASAARRERWDYLTAVRNGLFCELGRGAVDFKEVTNQLRAIGYDGWIVVEQDVLPSLGTPFASAQRNRQYVATLGL